MGFALFSHGAPRLARRTRSRCRTGCSKRSRRRPAGPNPCSRAASPKGSCRRPRRRPRSSDRRSRGRRETCGTRTPPGGSCCPSHASSSRRRPGWPPWPPTDRSWSMFAAIRVVSVPRRRPRPGPRVAHQTTVEVPVVLQAVLARKRSRPLPKEPLQNSVRPGCSFEINCRPSSRDNRREGRRGHVVRNERLGVESLHVVCRALGKRTVQLCEEPVRLGRLDQAVPRLIPKGAGPAAVVAPEAVARGIDEVVRTRGAVARPGQLLDERGRTLAAGEIRAAGRCLDCRCWTHPRTSPWRDPAACTPAPGRRDANAPCARGRTRGDVPSCLACPPQMAPAEESPAPSMVSCESETSKPVNSSRVTKLATPATASEP